MLRSQKVLFRDRGTGKGYVGDPEREMTTNVAARGPHTYDPS